MTVRRQAVVDAITAPRPRLVAHPGAPTEASPGDKPTAQGRREGPYYALSLPRVAPAR